MAQIDSSLDDFLGKLSSRAPTPGGGSASAFIGAIAAALCGMVGRLNDRKDGTPGPLHETISRADALLSELKRSAEDDIEAFNGLAASWKLPDTSENQATKQAAIDRATRSPLGIMALALEVMKLAVEGLSTSKKNCLSDAGVAGLVAHAALEGARLNVIINLPGILDQNLRAELTDQAGKLRNEGARIRVLIDQAIETNYPA